MFNILVQRQHFENLIDDIMQHCLKLLLILTNNMIQC